MASPMIVVNNGGRASTDNALGLLLGFTESFELIWGQFPPAVRALLPIPLVALVGALAAE